MSNEQIKIGQTWEYLSSVNLGREQRTIGTLGGRLVAMDGDEVSCQDMVWFVAHARLVSPAPAPSPGCAPDRTKCAAWCGCMWGFMPMVDDTWFTNEDVRPGGPDKFCWCSPACRDARVPQLPAMPVTTGAKTHAICIHCGVRPRVARMSCEPCLREDEIAEGAELGRSKPAANDLGTSAPGASGPTLVNSLCTCPDDDQPGHLSDCPRFEALKAKSTKRDTGPGEQHWIDYDVMFARLAATEFGRKASIYGSWPTRPSNTPERIDRRLAHACGMDDEELRR